MHVEPPEGLWNVATFPLGLSLPGHQTQFAIFEAFYIDVP